MRTALVVVVLASLACQGPEEQTYQSTPANGGSTVVITSDAYPDNPMQPMGSMAVFQAASCPIGWVRMVLYVRLSWTPGMCRMHQEDERHVGTGFVYVSVDFDRYDDVVELPPGTYPITGGNDVDVLGGGTSRLRSRSAIIAYGPMCYVSAEVPATGGTFTIESADATGVTGSVDLTFWDGSTAKGSFSSPLCDELGDVCQGAIHRVSDTTACLP
jgi:hypothetical protein